LLARRLVRPALAAAWEFVETREDAEDIVQEAFARTWRDLGRYDAAQPFAPWFFTIVRNVARTAHRRDRRWTLLPLDDDVVDHLPGEVADADPLEQLQQVDFDARIHTMLMTLSPMQRACFRLVEVEGFSRLEVADMLGVSPATVRVHIHRARKALQSLLGARQGAGE
jgi:RNA polymerase sigma-70 factor (ECF subfamily)